MKFYIYMIILLHFKFITMVDLFIDLLKDTIVLKIFY